MRLETSRWQRLKPKPYYNLLVEWDAKLKHKLSPRELEVAYFIIQGLSYKAVGEKLGVAESTVKFTAVNIGRKTKTTGRAGITAMIFHRLILGDT